MVIDNLYYGEGHHGEFQNASFEFNTDVLSTFLRRIYNGFDTSKDFEPTMWREILRIINEGTVEGLSSASYDVSHEKEFLKSLAHSNEVFSAFKVHDMGVDMAKKLVGADGKTKSFNEWKKDVAPIASHYCGSWLQTEYNTAMLRGQFAAEWKQYEADSDIFPNLRWMPTTSATPDEEHKGYWMNRLTLPVGHKFWETHHPGDHWNCKCSLEQTDEGANPEVLGDIPEVKAQPGLKANPGKDGVMFDQTHPYFSKDCSHCFAHKGLKNILLNREKDCFNCPFINGCTNREQEKKTIEEQANALKKTVKDNDLMPLYGDKHLENLKTGELHLSNKSKGRFLTHAHHDYDVEAAIFAWNNPESLKYRRISPLGEGKDMTNPIDRANVEKKKLRHVESFVEYEVSHNGKTFIVKTEEMESGVEQFYSIIEK